MHKAVVKISRASNDASDHANFVSALIDLSARWLDNH
jgi:hypothetical protein